MEQSFLICAFPRSRTMWLSHFLSIPGYSLCTHEGCEFAGNAAEFWSNAEAYASLCQVYGNSDSANIFVLPSILAEQPMTRVVWIQRPITEVAKSMKNAAIPHSEKALRALLDLRDRYVDYFDLILNFDDLETAGACKQIWDLCLPSLPFDYGRWGVYSSQKIGYTKSNPSPVKQYAKFLEWAKKDMTEQVAY